MKKLPAQYEWTDKFTSPKVWSEARKHYGVLEVAGTANNIEIMRWAKETQQYNFYAADEVPWCGLFVGVCVQRAGYSIPAIAVRAKEWAYWGNPIHLNEAAWMDVLVFERPGGGHVGFYCGENESYYLVYGGNQSNAVGFAWIAKTRCIAVRRCKWKIGQPESVKKIKLTQTGVPSTNEV